MRLIAALWRDEAGLVVASELIIVGTVLVITTLTGVFLVRIAVMYMFMGVATDMARQQRFEFDTLDTAANAVGQTVFPDQNSNGLVGYSKLATPAGPPQSEKKFEELFPGVAKDGERPVTIQGKPPQAEGGGS